MLAAPTVAAIVYKDLYIIPKKYKDLDKNNDITAPGNKEAVNIGKTKGSARKQDAMRISIDSTNESKLGG